MLLNIVILLILFVIMCLIIINYSPKIIQFAEEHFKDV